MECVELTTPGDRTSLSTDVAEKKPVTTEVNDATENRFLRGALPYSTLQPVGKRSVATDTETDHYSDGEAPLACPRSDWVRIKSNLGHT